MSTTPRRPLVPGPSDPQPTQKSIAERAIALREQRQDAIRAAQDLPAEKTNGGQMLRREPTLPIYSPIGKISAAVAAVMSEIGTIQKTGYNAFHKYKYASMGDVFHAVTPLMGRHGIMYTQNEIEVKPIENNRLAVLYEFVFSHASGESLPPIRFTSLVMARDSKGSYDDKALNKAHSNARKYVVIQLFNIPAGDFDDPDADEAQDANQRQERRPVPGPKETQETSAPGAGNLKEITEKTPRRITLGQGKGVDQWAAAFIKAIGEAETVDIVKAWDSANDVILQNINDNYPGTYDMIQIAVSRRLSDLSQGMPDPKADPVECLNWVAEQLQTYKSWDAAEAFWNQIVAPREAEFDRLDWEMLMQEYERAKARLDPPDDEPAGLAQ